MGDWGDVAPIIWVGYLSWNQLPFLLKVAVTGLLLTFAIDKGHLVLAAAGLWHIFLFRGPPVHWCKLLRMTSKAFQRVRAGISVLLVPIPVPQSIGQNEP